MATLTRESLDAAALTTRELNSRLRTLVEQGVEHVEVHHPAARHNLAVALSGRVRIEFLGPVGYFCGALGRGPEIEVNGNAGWSVGADLMDGAIRVNGNSGASTGASARGGRVVVTGDSGARTAIALKAGLVMVGGSVGYMTGFQMQNGTVVVCGDSGEGFGDSMYRGTLFIGGRIGGLGADTTVSEPTEEELQWLRTEVTAEGLDADRDWKKVTSAGRLWRFDKREIDVWREAL